MNKLHKKVKSSSIFSVLPSKNLAWVSGLFLALLKNSRGVMHNQIRLTVKMCLSGPPSWTASFPGSSPALLRSSHMTSWQPHRCLGTGRCWEYFCMAAGHVRKHSQWSCEVPATSPCNKLRG